MIKVLIVEDSPVMSNFLTRILDSDPDIKVIDTASNPYEAREKIKAQEPDVITLDIQMPKMDGLKFLDNLMRLRPIPVVMVSSLTQEGADKSLQALSLGAVDCIGKPSMSASYDSTEDFAENLNAKVKGASKANVKAIEALREKTKALLSINEDKSEKISVELIAIAASTGGTEALREVLQHFDQNTPPIVVTQHILPQFNRRFVERLNGEIALTAKEVNQTEPLARGHVYFAPADAHLSLFRSVAQGLLAKPDNPDVGGVYLPSATVMLNSVAKVCKKNAIGIMLTGMGDDGAAGLLAMKHHGAHTIVQDENSSLIWGMPKSAIELGAAQEVLALHKIGSKINHLL